MKKTAITEQYVLWETESSDDAEFCKELFDREIKEINSKTMTLWVGPSGSIDGVKIWKPWRDDVKK